MSGIDLLTLATANASIVALLSDFNSTRKGNKLSSEDFNNHFNRLLENDNNNKETLQLILENTEILINFYLNQSEELNHKIQKPFSNIFNIKLAEYNKYDKNNIPIPDLVENCLVKNYEEENFLITVEVLPSALELDPITAARNEFVRKKRAKLLEIRLNLLFCKDLFKYFKANENDISGIFSQANYIEWVKFFLDRAEMKYGPDSDRYKLDVWRTKAPQLSCPIYLSQDLLDGLLKHLGFSDFSNLAMGAYWRSANEMPFHLISDHVIPQIIIELAKHIEQGAVVDTLDVFDLNSWHIGQG